MSFRHSKFIRVAGRSNVLRYPLRRIVGEEGGLEVLECGHKQRPRRDLVGVTNAVRRRCWRCARDRDGNDAKAT